MIGIIDYKAGNSHSVYNACKKLEIACKYVKSPEDFQSVTSIILPGVGSSKATMDSLKEMKLITPLEKAVMQDKTPFLGICVGLQVLFEYSEEGENECLGWLKGRVIKFDPKQVRVPQIGWNKIIVKQEHHAVNCLQDESYLYFVNSYHAVPDNQEDILATAIYGEEFVAMVKHKNILATQCHIEKSGPVGLAILKKFDEFRG